MRIVHFQRKPVSNRYFSIENYFQSVRTALHNINAKVDVKVCSRISQGLFNRMYNSIEAAFRQGDVNHVTGDVHYLALFLAKRKTVLTIHDCVFMQHPSSIARAVLKLFWLTLPAKRVSYITCISESTRNEVLKHIEFPAERILVIPTVVNEQLFKLDQRAFQSEMPVILHIGTTPNKNLERVAAALKGFKCRLEIVGPLSPDQVRVLDENKIVYSNEVAITNERMAEKYREADLLLFVSTYEGFGMPILEAQLTGRAVITSDYSSMPEVAGDSTCLINPFSVESIREGVEKVCKDENYRLALIEKGKLNTQRFTASRIAAMFLDIYKKLG